LATPFYFAFGDEPKLVKNSTLAVMLLAGLLGAVLSASASLARELRTGTALAVLSKPVGRAQFLLAKYAGLIAGLALLTYVNMVAALLASRMAFDAYGSTDLFAVGIFALALVIAYMMGGFSNFFLRRPFVSDCVFSLMLTVTVAFVVISFYSKEVKLQEFAKGVDWRLIPASVLILFALWILAGWRWPVRPGLTSFQRWRFVPCFSCWGSCRITFLDAMPRRGRGGPPCFTPSLRTGNYSGSRTHWKRTKRRSIGLMLARHSAM